VADVASVECDQVITHGAYSKLSTSVLGLAMGRCDHDLSSFIGGFCDVLNGPARMPVTPSGEVPAARFPV